MENYRFAKHNLSDSILGYAAGKGISASKLRSTKYGYNYDNMLSILEMRAEMGNAKYDDLSVAVKLYDNIRKMSQAKRARVDYESLKSRAQKVYSTLADSLVKDAPQSIETIVAAQPESAYSGLGGKLKRMAGIAKLELIGNITAGLICLGSLGWLGSVVYNQWFKPAKQEQRISELLPVTAPAAKPAVPVAAPVPEPTPGPLPSDTYAGRFEDGAYDTYMSARAKGMFNPLPSTTEAPAPAAPVIPTTTEAPKSAPVAAPVADPKAPTPAPKPVTKQASRPAPVVEKPMEYVPAPAYIAVQKSDASQPASEPYAPKPVVTQRAPAPATSSSGNGNSNLTLKAILHDEAYADPHVLGDSATAKLILDSGNWGLDLYGNGFVDSEHYKDYTVDGTGARVWGGAHMYLPLSGKTLGFIEGNAGYEDRGYTVDFDSGSKLDFGNKGAFVNGKLGLTNGKLDDPENFGVGNKQNFVLLQGTKNWGDATGDFTGDYDAWRASAKGRLMLSPEFSAEAGVAGMHEAYGDSMSQDKVTAEGGVRWHTSISGNPAFVEMLGIYQKLDSEVNGSKSDDVRYGPQVGFGWRLASGDNVTLDATLTGGYLWSQEGDNEWRVMPGVTLYFGKKSK